MLDRKGAVGSLVVISKFWQALGSAATPLLSVLVAAAVLSGCVGGLTKGFQESLSLTSTKQIDFEELEYYALRSRAAYDSADQIRRIYPDTSRVVTVNSVDVRYFLETDSGKKTQTISIRGTDNRKNVWQDVEVLLVLDSFLRVKLHSGFRDTSLAVYKDVKPHLKRDHAIRLTGHSLGGAIALIVTNYLYREGYKVERLVTFGQPKVTGDQSNNQYKTRSKDYQKITRVVREKDPVPMVPPGGLLVKYGHVGPELILKPGADYVYLDVHQSDRLSVDNYWRNAGRVSVKEHKMDLYLQNIQGKIKNGSRQVAYTP